MVLSKIDLRSDTVTLPSDEMKEAMARAPLGDDVFGEDPTVNELQQLAARMTGKDSALFVASGTMGNLVSLIAHCGRGDEVILGRHSHIHLHEQGGISALGGIHPRVLPNNTDGTMSLDEIERAINEEDIHHAETKLICLENTWHGRAVPLSFMERVRELADKHGLQIHLDGARLFNAATALQVPASMIASYADSVQFCLSKGLAAPVGSLICGSEKFIGRCRRMRKLVGGGMRQAGVLAACGLVSLTSMVERLKDDHDNARYLAAELKKLDGIKAIDSGTNMVFVQSCMKGYSDRDLLRKLEARGILAFDEHEGIRLVTHYGIEREHVDEVVRRTSAVLDEMTATIKV